MAETRTYMGHTYTRDAPGQPWSLVAGPSAGVIVSDPKAPYEVQSAAARAQSDSASAPFAGPKAEAETRKTRAEAARIEQENELGPAGQTWTDATTGYFAKRYGKLMEQADSAREMLAMYDMAEDAIRNGPRTGFGAEAELNLRRFGQAIGLNVDPGKISGGELLRAVQNRMALMMRSPDAGTGMPGALSDRDISFLKDSQIGLDRSPEGNERLLRAFRAVEQRKIDIARLADDYVTAHGRLDTGFNNVVRDYSAATPAFQPQDVNSGKEGNQGAGAIPAGPTPFDLTVAPGGTPPPPGSTPVDIGEWNDSLASQGLSGINTAIGNTLGLPVDVTNAGLGLGLKGVNALIGTNWQAPQNPVGGSEWFRDVLAPTIGPRSNLPGRDFTRRVGESVGAALIPVAGTAGTLGRAGAGLLSAAGGGVAAALANQVAPDNPYVEMGAELAGSGLTGLGLYGVARRSARQAAEAAVPTVQQLKDQAGDLYRQAESRGVVAGPNVTSNLAGKVRQIAQDEGLVSQTGRVSEAYPRAAETMRILDDAANGALDVKQIQVMRETLADAVGATQGKERRISQKMLKAFDEETTPLAPELAEARQVSGRYLQANDINQARDMAEVRASQFSQSGMENALRTDFRGLDREIVKGESHYPSAVAEAIQNVSRGTPAVNVARRIGKMSPTSGIPIASGASIGTLGTLMAGPGIGGALTSGMWGGGAIARALAEKMTSRNAEIAELLARNGGELITPAIVTPDVQRMIAASLAAQTNNAAYDN